MAKGGSPWGIEDPGTNFMEIIMMIADTNKLPKIPENLSKPC